MQGNFSKGLIAGGLLGAAAGMLLLPRMGMKNKKRISRISRKIFRSF